MALKQRPSAALPTTRYVIEGIAQSLGQSHRTGAKWERIAPIHIPDQVSACNVDA